jgi:hypothetical protein
MSSLEQPMRAIKSPRLATHAVALQKQPGMQLSTCHPLDPFRLTHGRSQKILSRCGSKAVRTFFFLLLSVPPLFCYRTAGPRNRDTETLPCVSSLHRGPVLTGTGTTKAGTCRPNGSMPAAGPGRRNTTGTIPSVLSRPGWRRSITATGPGVDGAGPRSRPPGNEGRCLANQSIQPSITRGPVCLRLKSAACRQPKRRKQLSDGNFCCS